MTDLTRGFDDGISWRFNHVHMFVWQLHFSIGIWTTISGVNARNLLSSPLPPPWLIHCLGRAGLPCRYFSTASLISLLSSACCNKCFASSTRSHHALTCLSISPTPRGEDFQAFVRVSGYEGWVEIFKSLIRTGVRDGMKMESTYTVYSTWFWTGFWSSFDMRLESQGKKFAPPFTTGWRSMCIS